jgi:cyclophilin family peptidyl-prolyl cis-trans isomerase
MKPRRSLLPALALSLAVAACTAAPSPRPECPAQAPTADQAAGVIDGATRAVVVTNKGEFGLTLLPDAAPIATANFVALAECGFYDGITFHRVIPGFVAQAGDPQTRDNHGDFEGLGTGGPGYRFTIEVPPEGVDYDPYVVAMANSGQADSNGSQFFVNLTDLDSRLPRSYTIFGRVESGTDVVDAIGQVPTSASDLPLDAVVVETIRIEGRPEESPAG